MFKKFFNRTNTISGGAMIIALFSILSRVLGLLRDRLLSSTFGAGQILDSYYAAFRLPDFIFQTLILGAFSSAFIPVFLGLFSKDQKKAWGLTNRLLNLLLGLVIVLAILFFILAPYIIPFMVPGFSEGAKDLTIKFTRIMMVGTIFFTLSNVLGSVLKSFQKFLVYSIAPVFYNIGIIIGILFLIHTPLGITGLAWGVVIGALLHFLIQVPTFLSTGFKWRPVFKATKSVKKVIGLMIPRCIGLAANQLNFIVVTFVASLITIGAVAVYNLAFNLVHIPISLFGISLAVAVFPMLSRSFSIGDKKKFSYYFSKTVKVIIFITLPVTVIFLALRAQIVRIILGAGLFTWEDTVLTSTMLGWFSFSIIARSLIPIFARGFYACQNTKTPVVIAVISFSLNIVLCIILGLTIGVGGLALSFSIASILNVLLLYFYFDKKISKLFHKEILYTLVQSGILTGIMVIFLQIVKLIVADFVNMQTFLGIFLQASLAGIGAFSFYLALGYFFNVNESRIFFNILKGKIKTFKIFIKKICLKK